MVLTVLVDLQNPTLSFTLLYHVEIIEINKMADVSEVVVKRRRSSDGDRDFVDDDDEDGDVVPSKKMRPKGEFHSLIFLGGPRICRLFFQCWMLIVE